MTSSQSDKDITLSSQPFEPGSTMKKRKTAHTPNNANANGKNGLQAPTDFEQELKLLNDDMDIDIKSKFHSRKY